MKKIVLTGGGTAGHVTPNIALLPKLKELGYEVYYIGSYEGIEKKLIDLTVGKPQLQLCQRVSLRTLRRIGRGLIAEAFRQFGVEPRGRRAGQPSLGGGGGE